MAIKVNLLPREERPRRRAVPLAPPAVGPAGLVLRVGTALLVLVALYVGYSYWSGLRERDDLRRAVVQLQEQDKVLKSRLTELDLVRAAKREIERRIDIIGRVAKSQKVPLTMMQGVMTAVPPGVWLTALDMKPQEVQVQVEAKRPPIAYSSETLRRLEEKKQEAQARPARAETKTVSELRGFSVVIKGLAFNNQQVADFMENLRKAGFGDVDFTVTQATSVEQVRVMSFELTASVSL